MYFFLSGFTAKIPGTEDGITEPQPTFSTCFGAPFMPRHPGEYARLLAQKVQASGARVWLVNTGWTGGMYGQGQTHEHSPHAGHAEMRRCRAELDARDL